MNIEWSNKNYAFHSVFGISDFLGMPWMDDALDHLGGVSQTGGAPSQIVSGRVSSSFRTSGCCSESKPGLLDLHWITVVGLTDCLLIPRVFIFLILNFSKRLSFFPSEITASSLLKIELSVGVFIIHSFCFVTTNHLSFRCVFFFFSQNLNKMHSDFRFFLLSFE